MTKKEHKQAKALLKEFVIQRDWYKCVKCGSTKKGLHLCHIYPEGEYERLKYEPDNVFLACYHCHLQWWHKNPIEAYKWYISHFSPYRRQKLNKLVKNYGKCKKPNFQEIKALCRKKTK